MKKIQEYFIGIDAGTNSIGFAIVDENYNLIKKNGKHLWGVRLFDAGVDAKQRRLQRGQRRRIERRKERIRLLQELFMPLMANTEENFFRKLKQSYLQNVENDNEFGRVNIYNLFDGEYDDTDYFKEYPSIYHLRKALIEKNEKFDIRLVYLAIHNLIKFRGNFLYEDEETVNCGASIEQGLKEFFEKLDEYCSVDELENSGKIDYDKFFSTLLDKNAKKHEKKDVLKSIISNSITDKIRNEQVVNLLLGYDCDVSKIFGIKLDEDLTKEKKQLYKISLDGEKFEEGIIQLEGEVEEAVIQILREAKKTYDSIKFVEILGDGNAYMYQGMIGKYEKYGKDLDKLRNIIKENIEDKEFIAFYFKSEKDIEKYKKVVVIKENKKGYSIGVKRNATTKEDNQKILKSIIEKCVDSDSKTYILEEIKNGTFLKPLNTVDNGVVPYQILLNELKIIIDNQSKYYDYLKEIKDKIISIMSFKRPYFVGTLKGNHSWIDDNKIKERVYPWNFEELVDYEQLQERFIENLTGHCMFFPKEDVLPKCSIYYQKYLVLNQINTIKYKNCPITIEQKQSLFNNLFLKQKNVKPGDVAKFLNDKFDCHATKEDIAQILSDKTKFLSMSSYLDMKNCFQDEFSEEKINLYEDVIKFLTIFNDKKTREKALLKLGIKKEIVTKLIRINYTGWGKFSKKLLTQVYDAEGRNIIQVMYDENRHFNNIIYDETLPFYNTLFKNNADFRQNIAYAELVKNEYASPSVKRTVWQAVKVVKEITKIMGCKPKGIYIESTREESVKKQTSTRLENVKELYKSVKNDCEYYNKELEDFLKGDEKEINQKLKSDFVYLYLMQMGRSMYSGKPLDINNLSKTCEIDHIVPRCYIKDDSLSNRVLVLKEENQKKTSTLGIQQNVVNVMFPFWSFLYKNGFISKKKYFNLQKTEYTENELNGFVNKQLTETSQSAKLLRDTLKKIYDSDINMINAGLSTQLRRCMTEKEDEKFYSFYKIRELNDFHHAKDAYLAVVLSMFVKNTFPAWGQTEDAKIYKRLLANAQTETQAKDMVNNRYGIIIDKLVYWNDDVLEADENGELLLSEKCNTILKTMDYNDCLVSKKLEKIADQAFYNQTIYSPSDVKSKISQRFVVNNYAEVKPLPAEKYGGFSGEGRAYFVNIGYKKGKKTKDEIYFVPTLINKKLERDKNILLEYFKEKLAQEQRELIEINKKTLYKYQQINFNGQKCLMASEGEVQNATQLVVNKKYNKILYYITKAKGELNERLKAFQEEFEPVMNEFIEVYISKLNASYYKNYNGIAEKLNNYYCKSLADLDYASKVKLINDLLVITKLGASRVDISGVGSSLGRLRGKILTTENTKFYDVSVTGFYVKEIKF